MRRQKWTITAVWDYSQVFQPSKVNSNKESSNWALWNHSVPGVCGFLQALLWALTWKSKLESSALCVKKLVKQKTKRWRPNDTNQLKCFLATRVIKALLCTITLKSWPINLWCVSRLWGDLNDHADFDPLSYWKVSFTGENSQKFASQAQSSAPRMKTSTKVWGEKLE